MFLITCTTLTMETPKTDKASGDSVVAALFCIRLNYCPLGLAIKIKEMECEKK